MSNYPGYPTKQFSETQKFFVLDPNTQTPSFVSGADLVSYLTPSQNYVYSESTRTTAQATDYPVGAIIETAGATSAGDNFAAVYLVVAAGEGDFPMDNGNELLVIKGDEFLREQLAQNTPGDGSDLVAHTGTTDTVTQALDKRTIYVGSVAEIEALSLVDGQQAHLASGGRTGPFRFNASDLSAEVAADPLQGVYIAPDSDPTGSSGASVRQYGQSVAYNPQIKASWFAGATDDETLISALNFVTDNSELDLCGADYTIYDGVAGVTTGDAVPLEDTIRLFGKSNIHVFNGNIAAANPSVSGTKYRFPTTLTIDGCSGIKLSNVNLYSKGESWGDTDASQPLGPEDRRTFAAQNGGHALLVVRSIDVDIRASSFRLCGSVGSFYSISSHNVNLSGCFSNPGSLGYAAYAFDSWAGNTSVSGFPAHHAKMSMCSASKEGYTFGSKGCVLTEDADVSVIVNGGYFADAYPNGTARDLGYAFGASSSQTIVNGATVDNCASIGYAATTNGTDFTYLTISNVVAKGLRKTVHQDKDASFGRTYAKYTNVDADVVGGSLWPGDGDLTREATSYVALPNAANRIGHVFQNCTLTGATYGIITDNQVFGHLYFDKCHIETNGYLWSIQGLGGGADDQKLTRGIVFSHCAIEDISALTSPYTSWVNSANVYIYLDMETSTITLNSERDIESSTIASPGTYIIKYNFPRPDAAVETLTAAKALKPESAKFQSLKRTDAAALVNLPRPDKFKFMTFTVVNTETVQDLVIRDYLNGTTYITLTPGQAAACWNDGVNDYVRLL